MESKNIVPAGPIDLGDCSCNRKMEELIRFDGYHTSYENIYREIYGIAAEEVAASEDYGAFIVHRQNAHDALSLDELIRKYGDLTGYEWYCNELYVPGDITDGRLGYAVCALLDCLGKQLSRHYPGKVFFICISVDTGEFKSVTAHYHRLRSGERYINENLEDFDQPVMTLVLQT